MALQISWSKFKIAHRRPAPGRDSVTLTVAMVTVLLTVCQCYLELHWLVTFSIAVTYTLSLHHVLRDIFGGPKPLPRSGAVASGAG